MSCKHCENKAHHERGEEEHGIFHVVVMGISAILLLSALFMYDDRARLILCIAAYLPVGWPVLKEAGENLMHGEIFDENFLMSVASIGAFFIGEYPEAAAVMLLYSIGEALQDKAVDRSRSSIAALVKVRPDRATLCNGQIIPAQEVEVGTMIAVRPGERISLDGIITEGTADIDTAALTGEAVPRKYTCGDTVLAGFVVLNGLLLIKVTKPFGESAVSRIMTMVEEAQEKKAGSERFITRFSRIYTPVVCLCAVLLGVVPPLLGWGEWTVFLHKALAFLVISCPCALVISIPLTFFSGIGCASHHGILCKGSNDLEILAGTKVAAFDKTGTLTRGEFQIISIEPAEGITEERLLEIAAFAESVSNHPLAKCIVKAYPGEIAAEHLHEIREYPGYGVEGMLDGHRVLAGKRAMLNAMALPEDVPAATVVYLAMDDRYLGRILIADTVKDDAAKAVRELRKLGFTKLVMLSGDHTAMADSAAAQIGLDSAYGELLPEDKVEKVRTLKSDGICLYAGDGINDAPVLAAADVGIAMGGLGADAAMEVADVIIMSDAPSCIPLAVRIARRTMRIAKENIVFCILIKLLILILSAAVDLGLWLAVFADVGVCMLAIGNSLRALHVKE